MPKYVIIALETTHETMALEDWLKAHRFWHEVIPKPAKAKTECGLALKIKRSEKKGILKLLRNEKIKIKNLYG